MMKSIDFLMTSSKISTRISKKGSRFQAYVLAEQVKFILQFIFSAIVWNNKKTVKYFIVSTQVLKEGRL